MLGKMQWIALGLAAAVVIGGGVWIAGTRPSFDQFPPRFQVQVSGRLGVDNFKKGPDGRYLVITGERQFRCDLTKHQEMACVSPGYNPSMMASTIEIRRHVHDPEKATLVVFGATQDNVTWPMLKNGMDVKGTRLIGSAVPE